MSAHEVLMWTDGHLMPAPLEASHGRLLVADSWRVSEGTVLALNLHRDRFLATARETRADADAFWDATVATLPRQGSWFPRVEVREIDGASVLLLRLRPAPAATRSVVLETHRGDDPRRRPAVKGPSLDALEALRAQASTRGVDDLVLLDALGHIAEGAASAIAWWRGDILCFPTQEIDRVDSVTARALAAVAVAGGFGLSWETTPPEELDGHEVWALNSLHGPRIVTRWNDGPAMAEQPGRVTLWRSRLEALRRPLPALATKASL